MNNLEIQYYEHLCLCGCGGQIEIRKSYRKNEISKYINGHNRRIERKKCKKLGCSKLVLYANKKYCSKECYKIDRSENNPMKNKEIRNKVSKSNTGKKHTKEHNQKISEGNKGRIVSEETRQKISSKQKGQKRENMSGENHPMFGKHQTEETRKKIGIKSKEMWENLDIREKILKSYPNRSGENSFLWEGGKSFEIYPQEFKQIRKYILERDIYQCQNSNCKNINYKRLDIHHIDYNKKNNNPENLIVLCINCHAQTNGKNKREIWKNYYKEIITIYL